MELSETGSVWEIKPNNERQIKKGWIQIAQYVMEGNIWKDYDECLSIGGFIPSESFVYEGRNANYLVCYHYAGQGVIAYDYYKIDNEQRTESLVAGTVIVLGILFLIIITDGAAAPVLLPI